MSAYEYQAPMFRLRCNHDGCPADFPREEDQGWRTKSSTRAYAERAGWDVQPWRGEGARSDKDFCPEHAGTAR